MTTTALRNDAEIERDVSRELEWDPRVDSSEIIVKVKHGVVTLLGAVDSHAKRLAACHAAHSVMGVNDVADELQVKPAIRSRTDVEVAKAVRHALEWDVYVPDSQIQSTVSDGWVTLEGEVDHGYQREDAARAVERLIGVRGVTNKIVFKPARVDPGKIRTSIEDALTRQTEREAKRIQISVAEGVVTLTGTVRSWVEKNAIQRVALYSPGVRRVENHLIIDSHAD
jgi:osmotically-inducible protein OsmY